MAIATHNRLWIGETDVFDGYSHQAAGDVERVFAPFEHAS
jgi:hypothetical protein